VWWRLGNCVPKDVNCWEWLLWSKVGERQLTNWSHGLFFGRHSARKAVYETSIHVQITL
jgi:hypothetical protein